MNFTETVSNYDNLEQKSVAELLRAMNDEDKTIPFAVERALPQIEKLVTAAYERMQKGGRLFYIGAGTSGRLGILDASEIPPTYGVSYDLVVGVIAGGDNAIRHAAEFAEDDNEQAWKDLEKFDPIEKDVLVGIAASGSTPYVMGGIQAANKKGLMTGCIVCNPGSTVAQVAQCPIEVIVGPEVVTGSTRMKAGTATKLVLNMISTALMIKQGRVKGNRMVDMKMSNRKLLQRGEKMLMNELNIDAQAAQLLIKKYGSVRKAIENEI